MVHPRGIKGSVVARLHGGPAGLDMYSYKTDPSLFPVCNFYTLLCFCCPTPAPLGNSYTVLLTSSSVQMKPDLAMWLHGTAD